MIRSPHCMEDLFDAEPFFEASHLIWAPYVFPQLPSLLCLLVQHFSDACFFCTEEMHDLDETTKAKLDPKVPTPMQVFFDGATAVLRVSQECTKNGTKVYQIPPTTAPRHDQSDAHNTAYC